MIRAFACLRAALALSAALVGAGCDCGREDGAPIDYVATDGTQDGVYESSPLGGVWLHFPGGRRYRLHHELGAAPVEHRAYLAFESAPVHDGGEHAEAAGNAVIWEDVNERFIQLRNGTCASFYVRVVAELAARGAEPAGTGTAGAPAAAAD